MKALGPLAAVLMLGMWATAALADGGTVLLYQDAGAFTITLFAAPQPLRTGEADLSVMVQDRRSGAVLLDPVIDVTAAPDGVGASQRTVRLARGLAGNRLLQAGTLDFPSGGKWRLALLVRRGNDEARLTTECIVETNRSRFTLVCFFVLLPVAVILLFAIHQFLKLRTEVSAP